MPYLLLQKSILGISFQNYIFCLPNCIFEKNSMRLSCSKNSINFGFVDFSNLGLAFLKCFCHLRFSVPPDFSMQTLALFGFFAWIVQFLRYHKALVVELDVLAAPDLTGGGQVTLRVYPVGVSMSSSSNSHVSIF